MSFRITRFETLESTNSYLIDLALKGEPEGLVVATDYQSQGRGQFEREWVSPAGKNLLFSLLLRPDLTAAKAPMLTQIACHSVASVLEKECGISTTIKFPNDLLVHGRKICGILVESSSQTSGPIDYAIVGIGLNVHAKHNEIPENATSVIMENHTFDWCRNQLMMTILKQIKQDLHQNSILTQF